MPMFDIASTTDALLTAYSNVGVILSLAIASLLVGLVALLGLGFGIHQLKKHVTGTGFIGTSNEYSRKRIRGIVHRARRYIENDEHVNYPFGM